jgi:hypothetical protein
LTRSLRVPTRSAEGSLEGKADDDAKPFRLYARTRLLLVAATSLASGVGALLTVALLAIALAHMTVGVVGYVVGAHTSGGSGGVDGSAAILEACIRGVELLFLSPLPFLIPLSLGRYIRDSKEDRDDRRSKADLLSIKALTAALLIAVLASDIVGRALRTEGLRYEQSISTTLVIGVLAVYFFGLERQAREVKAEPPATEALPLPTGPEAL